MPSTPARTLDRYKRLRRRAVIWTAVFAPVLALHAVQFVVYLVDHDPRGAWIVYQGGLVTIGAGFVLWRLWTRARQAMPDSPRVEIARGLEDAPADHPSLTGQSSFPTRW
ncbi:MAG: hypothetical protein AAGC49_01765 [Brevundimonas sp.]